MKQALTKAQEELKIAQEELELANGELKSLQKIAQDKQDRYKTIKKQYELGDYLHATTKDAPTVEKPEFKFEIPKDAPTVEKPEFDISTLNKPTNPTTKAKEKEIVVNQKQGAILP